MRSPGGGVLWGGESASTNPEVGVTESDRGSARIPVGLEHRVGLSRWGGSSGGNE